MTWGGDAEPLCCGEPMVHNSWAGTYECAAAYFALTDSGVLGQSGDRILTAPEWTTDAEVELIHHWHDSTIEETSDGRRTQ